MGTVTDRRPGPRGGLLFTPETAPWRRPPAPRPAVPDAGWVRVGPAGRDLAEIEAGFASAWADVRWPARLWQVLAGADGRGVDLVTRTALLGLPAGVYRSAGEVALALAQLPPAYVHRRP